MASPVTDPALLAALNAPEPKGKVTDPALLAALEGNAHPLVGAHLDMAIDDPMGSGGGAERAPVADMGYVDQMRHVGGAVDSTVRSIANGIPFMDRIAAAAGAATGLGGKFGDYSGNLEAQRAEDKRLAEASPVLDTAGHIVGGALVPLGAAGAAAKGASLGAKSLVAALTGGAIGGVQGLSETKDITDIPHAAKDTAIGAGGGLVVGGLIPGASKVVGAVYQKAADAIGGRVAGMSRSASGHLVRGVEADGPVAVQQRLAELGPNATLADAGPALLGKAQGASLNSDEGRSILQRTLTARDKGTNGRIQSDVDRAIGPAETPQLVNDAILAHRSAVDNVNYPAALNNAPDVQTAHILTELDALIPRSVGMEKKALTSLRDMMMTTDRRPLLDTAGHPQYDRLGNQRWQDVPVSQNDAEVLHKVKGELDNVIQYDAPGLGVPAGALKNQQAALKRMRFNVNDALETQVPGYANANAVSHALANRAEAVKLGTQYLGNGKTTPSPEQFAQAFDPLAQGEKIALAKGSRGEIDRILGTKANDLVALKGELQGEGGWNTAKLATVHGQPAIDELVSSVDRNLKFRDTYNKVVENSQTAQRTAAQKAMKPDPSSDTPLLNPNSTLTGMAATVAKKGVQGIVNALTRSDPTRHYGEVARALTEQGSARDARLLAIIDALNSRQGNAAAAPAVGNAGAVVAAILGNAALRNGPMRKQQQ